MTTLGDLDDAVHAEIARRGRDAQVRVLAHGPEILLTTDPPPRRPHGVRDAALAAAVTPVAGTGLAHDLYLTQRAMGDVKALRNGRLPNRLLRRAATKRVWAPVMRRLG